MWVEVFWSSDPQCGFRSTPVISVVFNEGCFWQTTPCCTQCFSLQVAANSGGLWVISYFYLLLSKRPISLKLKSHQMVLCHPPLFVTLSDMSPVEHEGRAVRRGAPRRISKHRWNWGPGAGSAACRWAQRAAPKKHSTFSKLKQVTEQDYCIPFAAEVVPSDIFMPYETQSPWNSSHRTLILVIEG